MYFPNRIKTIGDFIPNEANVADVGADHGLLELYLISKHHKGNIVAIENKKGPYESLKNGLSDVRQIRLSLSSGLCAVDRLTDTVVIAGMGGQNIINILNEYPSKVKVQKRFVIDAHRDIPEVRKTLVNYGFEIKEEKIIFEEGKFYIISVFDRSENPKQYSDEQYSIGFNLEKDELWEQYKNYLLDQNEKLVNKIKNAKNMDDELEKLNIQRKRILDYGKNKII